MNWTACPIIEQIPGKMSGAPLLRDTRLRPQDVVGNIMMGEAWIADAFGVPLEDIRTVLAFYETHREELPIEYFPPEYIARLGADRIDWSGCPMIDRHLGEPAIRDTPVRPIDLIAHADEGADSLAASYGLSAGTVRSVLGYYQRHKRQLAAAV